MQTTEIRSINHTVEETRAWLDELVGHEPFGNEDQAYSGLRAVLHAIRDNLTAEEAAHLGSQLPMLVRGFYYEGWRPALAPNKERDQDAFLQHVQSSLSGGGQGGTGMDPAAATRAVTRLLNAHLTSGQIRHVRQQLHGSVEELWSPEGVQREDGGSTGSGP